MGVITIRGCRCCCKSCQREKNRQMGRGEEGFHGTVRQKGGRDDDVVT